MKKIDKYIFYQFLGTFAFTLIIILLISVVFDVSEKIDDFYRREAHLDAIIRDYYLNFVIHYGLLFSALFTFIAVIISTSKLANNTEVIAIKLKRAKGKIDIGKNVGGFGHGSID